MDEDDIVVFILWSFAAPQRARIVGDLRTKFDLVEAWRITWDPARFAHNLRRLYGMDLPERVDKVSGSGSGPFDVYVVRDTAPVYEPRARSWGLHPANVKAYDAKQLYREWTCGGFRIHASNDVEEAERDLFLLLGRRRASYLAAPAIAWDAVPTETTAEIVGASGWASREQLATALALTVHGVVESKTNGALTVRVDNVKRARQVAGGRRVRIAGESTRLRLRRRGPRRLPRPTRAAAA